MVRIVSLCVLAGAICLGFYLRKPPRALAQNSGANPPAITAAGAPTNAASTSAASTTAAVGTDGVVPGASTNSATNAVTATTSTNSAPTNAVAGAIGTPPGVTVPAQSGPPADEPAGGDVQLSFQNAQV